MSQSAKFTEYLKTVCGEVRWQRSHNTISRELLGHLEDQKSACMAEGMNESEAEQKAILEMGDPVAVGSELNSAYRPKTDWNLLLITVVFLIVGICSRLMMTGIESNFSLVDTMIGLAGGVLALILSYYMDFSMIGRYAVQIYAAFMVILIVMLLFSPHINGQSAYASYLMILFPLIFAGLVYLAHGKGILGIALCGFAAVVALALGMRIPSTSGVFIAGVSVLIILTYAISKGWFGKNKVAGLLVVYIPFAVLAIIVLTRIHALHRFAVIFNPGIDPNGAGYVGVATRKILGTAQLIGNSASTRDNLPLPNSNSQYLLTLMIQQVGWIALAAILLIFTLFILHGVRVCKKQESWIGKLLCISILTSFGLQCLCFVLNNLGLSAFNEFPLPLITGKISMILNFFLIGCLMSVFRNGCLAVDRIDSNAKSGRFQYVDGKLIISLK